MTEPRAEATWTKIYVPGHRDLGRCVCGIAHGVVGLDAATADDVEQQQPCGYDHRPIADIAVSSAADTRLIGVGLSAGGILAEADLDHEKAARIAELERRIDAVRALCDRTRRRDLTGYHESPCWPLDPDAVRRLLGGKPSARSTEVASEVLA